MVDSDLLLIVLDANSKDMFPVPANKSKTLISSICNLLINILKRDSFTLSDKNRHQVIIPPKFGNGHLVLSSMAIFHYKQNTYYNPEGQFTITWNDPEYNFWWPVKKPILSRRDEYGKFMD